MPSTHKKEKPWDTDDIDKWKVDPFTKEESSGAFLEESSFMTLFPKYRERYLKDSWPLITKTLDKQGITAVLDLVEGSMTVKTTRKVASIADCFLRAEISNSVLDIRPRSDSERARSDQTAGSVGAGAAGHQDSGGRHRVRHHQDPEHGEQQGAVRQEAAADPGTERHK